MEELAKRKYLTITNVDKGRTVSLSTQTATSKKLIGNSLTKQATVNSRPNITT